MSASHRDRLDFARRPFLDERPVWALVGLALTAGVVLLFANVRMYTAFHRNVANLKTDIEQLRDRSTRAVKDAEQARAALQSYKLSSLAVESQGLLNLVAERRFSWTAFLGRLERTLPPDVRLTRLAPRFEDSARMGLDIGLVGRSPESVVKTIAALSADPTFHGVDLKTEASPERGSPDGYSFELTVFYTPPEGK
jgi:Tfp pilus assembly protein PilN